MLPQSSDTSIEIEKIQLEKAVQDAGIHLNGELSMAY